MIKNYQTKTKYIQTIEWTGDFEELGTFLNGNYFTVSDSYSKSDHGIMSHRKIYINTIAGDIELIDGSIVAKDEEGIIFVINDRNKFNQMYEEYNR